MTPPTISRFDAVTCRALRPVVAEALAALGAQLGVTFDVGNMKYAPDGTSVSIALTGAVGDATSIAERETAARRAAWTAHASLFGFEPDDFGKEVRLGAKRYTLAGLPEGRSRRMLVRGAADGKEYRGDVDAVLHALGRPPRTLRF